MSKPNIFNSVKMTRPKRSKFDLSHDVKLSCNMGQLVPTLALEVVPSDVISIGNDSLLRLAPMLAPMMHRCDVSMHYFFVPNRILWDNWENYITNTKVGGFLPAHPYLTVGKFGGNYNKLMDYLGIPNPSQSPNQEDENINPFPMAAYQMICNEYYRDENLMAEIDYKLVDGSNNANADLFPLRNRCWEHDYFTAALPFAQKGDPVTIPIAQFEDVAVFVNDNLSGTPTGSSNSWTVSNTSLGGHDLDVISLTPSAVGTGQFSELFADTKNLVGGATSITDLRRAFQLQKFLETNATGGTRYTENIYAHFGIKSDDARLQRPEYITGTKSPIVISEVLNTTGTTSAPQGDMAGHGISVTQGKFGRYMAKEHGFVIGILSIMPKTAYLQGIEKQFLKLQDPFQYYWPEFEHIGEQPIENRELYAYATDGGDTFGYIPRYAEYKFKNNRVAGDFRTTLNFWHMARIFATKPSLNAAFVQADPTLRTFAVTSPTVDHCWMHVYHKLTAIRPMSIFGKPSI